MLNNIIKKYNNYNGFLNTVKKHLTFFLLIARRITKKVEITFYNITLLVIYIGGNPDENPSGFHYPGSMRIILPDNIE